MTQTGTEKKKKKDEDVDGKIGDTPTLELKLQI
jgi:hypothetical protein